MFIQIAKLSRPKHWVKNGFLFVPAFFAGVWLNQSIWLILIAGFLSFCFLASGVYIINDIRDKKFDQQHPQKRHRPVASGKVPVKTASWVSALYIIISLLLSYWATPFFFIFVLGYFILQVLYSFGGKKIALLDLIILSAGFLIRVYAGGNLANVPVSKWLVLLTFLLALFLGLAKRYNDFELKQRKGIILRDAIEGYNVFFIMAGLIFTASVLTTAYIFYTLSPEVTQKINNENIYITTFFVIPGILRYFQITFVENKSGNPTEMLFKDPFLIITVLGWLACFSYFIYA